MLANTFPQRKLIFVSPGCVEVQCGPETFRDSPYGVVIKSKSSLVSAGTEIALLHGNGEVMHGRAFPFQPSATITGEIVAVGKAVSSIRPDLDIGVRVVAKGTHSAFVQVDILRDSICALSDDFLDEHALISRLGRVALKAVQKVGMVGEKSVLVVGLGLVGQLVLRAAYATGHAPLFGCDPHQNRLACAACVPGVHLVASGTPMPMVDIVFMACPGGEAVNHALTATNEGGKLVLVGAGTRPVVLDVGHHVFRRGVNIIGAHERFSESIVISDQCLFSDGMDFLSMGEIGTDGLISEGVNIDESGDTYKQLIFDKDRYVGAYLNWG